MKIKKSLIGLIGSVAMLAAFASCGGDEPSTYRVTFVQDGQKSVFYTVEKGKALVDIPDPAPVKGYSVAWDLTGINLSNVTKDLTVYAVAKANEYKITYDTQGGVLGSATQTVVYDSEYKLAIPAHDSYPFDCWTYKGEEIANAGIWTIDENVTLVAKWEEVYKVTFKQFGQPDIVKTVVKGETLTDIPDVKPREGYKVEWGTFDPNAITGDTTVTAVETANEYTITYDAGEGTVSSATQNVIYDLNYELLTPTLDGYTFVCWNNGETPIAQKGVWKLAQEGITLVAEWKEIKVETCTVTFVQEGQKNVVKTVEKGSDLTDVPVPAPKKGYELAWDLEGVSLTNIQTNLVIHLIETPKEYTITYQIAGAKYGEPQKVAFGQAFALLETVDVSGYELVKWQKDGEDFIGGIWSVDSDVTLDAVLKAKSYFISYLVNETQYGEPQKVTFGEPFTLVSDVSVTGYEFAGWLWNGAIFEEGNWKIADNVVLKAKLEAKEYTITYLVDGNEHATQTVTFGKAFELPTVITINDQKYFVEWFNDGVKFTSGVWTTESDLSLTGEITLLTEKKFTVTLVVKTSCCKLTTTTIQVKYGQSTAELLKPTCPSDEHTFRYWTYNGVQIPATWDIVEEGEIVLVAKMKRNWTNNH